MDSYLPSELARLVLGYLKEEECMDTYNRFLQESRHLGEYAHLLRAGHEYPTNVGGLSLQAILNGYAHLVAQGRTPEVQGILLQNSSRTVNTLPDVSPNTKTAIPLPSSSSHTPVKNVSKGKSVCHCCQQRGDSDMDETDPTSSPNGSISHIEGMSSSVASDAWPASRNSSGYMSGQTVSSHNSNIRAQSNGCSLREQEASSNMSNVTPETSPMSLNPLALTQASASSSSFRPVVGIASHDSCILNPTPVFPQPTRCTCERSSGTYRHGKRPRYRKSDSSYELPGHSQNVRQPSGSLSKRRKKSTRLRSCENSPMRGSRDGNSFSASPVDPPSTHTEHETELTDSDDDAASNKSKCGKSQRLLASSCAKNLQKEKTANTDDSNSHVAHNKRSDPKESKPQKASLSPSQAESQPQALDLSIPRDDQKAIGFVSQTGSASADDALNHGLDSSHTVEEHVVMDSSSHEHKEDIRRHEEVKAQDATGDQRDDIDVSLPENTLVNEPTTPSKYLTLTFRPTSSMSEPTKTPVKMINALNLCNFKSPRRKSQLPKRRSMETPSLAECLRKSLVTANLSSHSEHSNSSDAMPTIECKPPVELFEGLINSKKFALKLARKINKVKFACDTAEEEQVKQPNVSTKESTSSEKPNLTVQPTQESDSGNSNMKAAIDTEDLLVDASQQGTISTSKEIGTPSLCSADTLPVSSESNLCSETTSTDQLLSVSAESNSSLQACSGQELDSILEDTQMSETDIMGIVEMMKNDPDFDTLFNMFSVDKHEYIERNYGVATASQSSTSVPASTSGTVEIVHPAKDGNSSYMETIQVVTAGGCDGASDPLSSGNLNDVSGIHEDVISACDAIDQDTCNDPPGTVAPGASVVASSTVLHSDSRGAVLPSQSTVLPNAPIVITSQPSTTSVKLSSGGPLTISAIASPVPSASPHPTSLSFAEGIPAQGFLKQPTGLLALPAQGLLHPPPSDSYMPIQPAQALLAQPLSSDAPSASVSKLPAQPQLQAVLLPSGGLAMTVPAGSNTQFPMLNLMGQTILTGPLNYLRYQRAPKVREILAAGDPLKHSTPVQRQSCKKSKTSSPAAASVRGSIPMSPILSLARIQPASASPLMSMPQIPGLTTSNTDYLSQSSERKTRGSDNETAVSLKHADNESTDALAICSSSASEPSSTRTTRRKAAQKANQKICTLGKKTTRSRSKKSTGMKSEIISVDSPESVIEFPDVVELCDENSNSVANAKLSQAIAASQIITSSNANTSKETSGAHESNWTSSPAFTTLCKEQLGLVNVSPPKLKAATKKKKVPTATLR